MTAAQNSEVSDAGRKMLEYEKVLDKYSQHMFGKKEEEKAIK